MITQVFLVHRRPDMSRDEFRAYWKDTHGPISAKIPGLRKYAQHHSIPDANGEPAFDGLAILSFDNADYLEQALSSPEWEAALADAPNFLDGDRLVAFTCETHSVI